MAHSISRMEQETHISFNAEEKTATIYTANPVYMRKLDKLCAEHPEVYQRIYLAKDSLDAKYLVANKKLIKIARPATNTMSDENREKARQRLMKYHNASKTE